MPVAGPDLQIRVGGGLKEKCFRPFRSQFGLKIRGRPGPPGPGPPGPRAPSLDAPQYAVLQHSKYRQPL